MLSFFSRSKHNDEKKEKSKSNQPVVSLVQITKSDNNNNNQKTIVQPTVSGSKKLNHKESTNSPPTLYSKNHSIFSIVKKDEKKTIENDSKQSKKEIQQQKPTSNVSNEKKKINTSVISLIINSDNDNEAAGGQAEDTCLQLFDPDPAPEETDTFEHITFIDDKSFIEDDEVNEITSRKLNGLAKENNCYTVNEVPEGRLSKISSSRASSRSSLASDSTRGSASVFGEQANNLKDITSKKDSSVENSEGSFGQNGNVNSTTGSKNVLLDALIRKFIVSMDLDTNSDNNSDANISATQTVPLQKQTIRYKGDDKNKKQSDLQRKINSKNLEKQSNLMLNNLKSISTDTEDKIEASSSYDDDPKQVKLVKSTSTQISRTLNKRNSNYQTINITKLPQHFECKYIGKTKCQGLWGLKHIRDPVDYLVKKAKRLRSLEDLVDVEALVTEKGIYVVQKSKPLTEKEIKENLNKISPKYYKSGLLPISNISYAVQDNLYGKVFSCIVVTETDGKTLSECYSFLCRKNEISRKMALSITLAFKEYGKLLQSKETRISRTIQMNDSSSEINGDSFA